MNHKFEHMVLLLSISCKKCNKVLTARMAITQEDFNIHNIQPEKAVSSTAEAAYNELDVHICTPEKEIVIPVGAD